MWTRRDVLLSSAGAAAAGAAFTLSQAEAAEATPALAPELPSGLRDAARLDRLPGKVPLIKLSYRPPNYETPIEYLRAPYTPNEAFFVRYHLPVIPDLTELATWTLTVGGDAAATPFQLDLAELRSGFEPVELDAVCQCSGNRRGLFSPHVPGVQWGYGAMGHARWKGARLRDVLNQGGVRRDAVELIARGADGPILPATPAFAKSLPLWKALDESVLIAYEMNGAPLPHLNGFPARLVVPGWTATYWMKHVTSLEVSTRPFDSFWVKTAYRLPKGKFPTVERFESQETDQTTPITEMVPNALVTNLANGQTLTARTPFEIQGIAWDGGYGLDMVEVSLDDGATWTRVPVGDAGGRFAVRPWSLVVPARDRGTCVVRVRASNRIGQTQPWNAVPNPSGYHHNAIQRIALNIA